jgi:predicted NBD/HSP70 family sugar kinase
MLLERLIERGDGGHVLLDARRRRLMLAAIARGGATRKRLAHALGLRSATVSKHVTELIGAGLVIEKDALAARSRGRPEIILACMTDAIVAIVLRANSDRFSAAIVDLDGSVVKEVSRSVDASRISAAGMEHSIFDMVRELRQSVPRSEVAGLAISLPGIVDEQARRWISSSRFPNVPPLDLGKLESSLGMEVMAHRALNAELRGRLQFHPHERQSTVVLFHWGYGISLTYAVEGQIISSGHGAFGEVGHWRVEEPDGMRCKCGRFDCVETKGALWALAEKLDIRVTEDELGNILRNDPQLASHPLLVEAGTVVAGVLGRIYWLLFPQRLVISGPFVQSPVVRSYLEKRLAADLPRYAPRDFSIDVAVQSARNEFVGAAKPLLRKAYLSAPRQLGG